MTQKNFPDQKIIAILYIHHSSRISGAEISLVSLLKNIDRKKYNPIIALPQKGLLYKKLKGDFEVKIVPMKRFKRVRNPFMLFSYLLNVWLVLWQISLIIRKNNIQLIHSNSTNAHIFGSLAGWINHIPSIWHVRDVVPLGILGKALFALSTRIIVTSRFVKSVVIKYRKRRKGKKISVIYNGVDLPLSNEEIKQKARITKKNLRRTYGFGANIFLVAMIGQLIPWKRQEDFIRIAEKVLMEIPSTSFLIAGEDLFDDHPGYKVRLQKIADSLGISDKVIFTGYCDDIPWFLKGIDILIHPAGNEPFGRAIVEAMAMGKPVVAIKDGGPAEIIEDKQTGYLIPSGDIEKMAEAVINLLRNPRLRKEMGKNGRKRVKKEFNINKHIKEVMKVYEHCY